MSGHSKWSTIKRKKGAADAKRGKIFTKLIRELATAARIGGGDPDSNPRLRLVVDKAKSANMPKDNIQRAIQKGVGGGEGANYEEMVYEGYGPGGAAILIEALTDNKNRTVSDVRHVLSKNGGNLGATGCVSYLFEKKGLLQFDRSAVDPDALMEAALDAGAADIVESEETLEVSTEAADFTEVKSGLESAGFSPHHATVSLEPTTTVALTGKDAEQMLRLADSLEDLDDVQNFYANFDISDEELANFA
ncbi:MAG: YebC/PmpR family DNA-binding transcriptional regulator [bacterium TMED88]|nr:YebC/PmpR family DNA-binding transcriptional regulator [Deltaproteobacteria bacterium]OUV21622.1 MAG: YebC/PmpR family DNA-binding transcriptional regulator [bacterium TMED88]